MKWHSKRGFEIAFFTLVLGFGMSATPKVSAALINGAGATFPAPLYNKWVSAFQVKNPNSKINYQSVGSGAGIKQFTDQTIHFGASDAPMTDEQIAAAKAKGLEPVHIPTVLGAVVMAYNLPGVESGLKLNAQLIGDIYAGKIKKWTDSRIKELNPNLAIPAKNENILVVYRSDGSGTTAIFTDYLSKTHADWKDKKGTSIKWPVGQGAKGNEGVSGVVSNTPGAITYMEFLYAHTNKLTFAALENQKKKFILPSVESVSEAAAGVKIPDDFRISIVNPTNAKAYPISGFTYLLVSKKLPGGVGPEIKSFLIWAMKEGQVLAPEMLYSPLPASWNKKVSATIQTLN